MYKEVVTDIFFDLDHTLWDFEKNSALTFEHIFKLHNVALPLDEFLEVYIPENHNFWKLYREEKITKEELRYQRLKVVFDALNYKASDVLIDTLSSEYIHHLSSFNHVFEGTHDILEYLKPNYKLHIITNGFKETQELKMKNSNILEYFDVVINSEMAGVKKPNPKIFKLALASAKTEAGRSLMIGDNLEADILGAIDSGLHALHFNAHQEPVHEHCSMIHQLHEIKNYL